jgi:hypothetical protein
MKRRGSNFVWIPKTTDPSPWIRPALSISMLNHQPVHPTFFKDVFEFPLQTTYRKEHQKGKLKNKPMSSRTK